VRARRLLAFGLLAGLIASCGAVPDKDGPTHTPSTTSASVPKPTPPALGANARPGETPPVLDADAREHTMAGAVSFSLFYFKAFDWSEATNDPSILIPLAAPSCRYCSTHVAALRSLPAKHERLIGSRLTIKTYDTEPNYYRVKAEYVTDIQLSADPAVLRGPTSTRTVEPALHWYHLLVFVAWRHGRWQVVEITGR
jgi:hypothetical protein